jgi:hypothetical protein
MDNPETHWIKTQNEDKKKKKKINAQDAFLEEPSSGSKSKE